MMKKEYVFILTKLKISIEKKGNQLDEELEKQDRGLWGKGGKKMKQDETGEGDKP